MWISISHYIPLGENVLCVVNVEEVGVKNCLDDACEHCDRLEMVPGQVREVSPYPVENVQSPINTERKQIVRCDCLSLACTLQHE